MVYGSFRHGQVVVSKEPVQLTADSSPCVSGLIVRAAVANSWPVYLGSWEEVTIETGFELLPGESLTLELNNAWLVWLVAAQPEQKIFWLGI